MKRTDFISNSTIARSPRITKGEPEKLTQNNFPSKWLIKFD
jgi:hypothetical protein